MRNELCSQPLIYLPHPILLMNFSPSLTCTSPPPTNVLLPLLQLPNSPTLPPTCRCPSHHHHPPSFIRTFHPPSRTYSLTPTSHSLFHTSKPSPATPSPSRLPTAIALSHTFHPPSPRTDP